MSAVSNLAGADIPADSFEIRPVHSAGRDMLLRKPVLTSALRRPSPNLSQTVDGKPDFAANSATSSQIRTPQSSSGRANSGPNLIMGTFMNAAIARAAKVDDTEAPSEFEGDIREFIRRDVAHLRRPATESSEQAVNNINTLLDRVSGSSVSEIDRLITDLRGVRDFLQNEGERVQREIQSYAQLST